jgi:hypothetical protein
MLHYIDRNVTFTSFLVQCSVPFYAPPKLSHKNEHTSFKYEKTKADKLVAGQEQ